MVDRFPVLTTTALDRWPCGAPLPVRLPVYSVCITADGEWERGSGSVAAMWEVSVSIATLASCSTWCYRGVRRLRYAVDPLVRRLYARTRDSEPTIRD